MQTFLPYSNIIDTVKCLDYRRLGKQRVEAKTIISILEGNNKSMGWVNHPAVKMWRGHTAYLKLYYNACITEWISRGYKNTMCFFEAVNPVPPKWLGNEEFHRSHRSNLLRKNNIYYGQFGWTEPNNLPYIWPV